MNNVLIDTVVAINRIFYFTVGNFLKFLNFFPYWISVVLVSFLAGLIFIPVFKYFSNQLAVRLTRDRITADLLSIRIFKDNPVVMIRAQGRILLGTLKLLWHTLPAFLIMIVPVSFLLTQMSGWYQFRPLKVGETAVITLKLSPGIDCQSFNIDLETPQTVDVLAGPVCIESQNELLWTIVGREISFASLKFKTLKNRLTKTLAVGESGLPVSIKRPERNFGEVFLYPFERPLCVGAPIRSIALTYGDPVTDPSLRLNWLVVFCIVSMLVFLMFKRFFKVVV